MKYLKFTYVDAVTEISVAAEPARNGPKFPPVQGLTFVWARESAWPTDVPEFFGTCPDDAMTQVDGVLAVLDAQDFENMRLDELRARNRVPDSITMRQCRLQLLATGKLGLVQPAIDAMPEPQRSAANIEWEYGSTVLRSSPLIAQLAPVLGWDTPEAIDEQFRLANLR